ncbi:MAG: hypothetical protein AB1416_10140, partial [Actinomycetota bacterium]
ATPAVLGGVASVALGGGGRSVSVRISCSAAAVNACRGTVTLATRAGARRVALGRAPFRGLLPGRARSVAVPLSRAGRALLAGRSALLVTVTTRTSDARGVVRTVTARRTLRLSRR